ncbi:protocatechuate 3,4-dioxygenase [Dechloromonas sp. XY25]|uniref:Protocatechuate 3,4-dioxygenase n=1 Tax=Dechloromonas hankyongensis TaxID=2908002 RepID=A0ABS9K271_9RHOO|nr:protocatechuate 3,4-dioxygenase [Dechloromonas hankyongensis]MCG2577238.1 protocatechuate 3,4-dioxygenase [Dechloromonas hankyongensis]
MPLVISPASTRHERTRRRLVAALLAGAPAWCLGVSPQPAANRRATPAQTEGPFYPVVFPKDSDNDLLRNGAFSYPEGQAVWLEGTVSDLAGRPVAGAQVEIWQCDHAGHYHHPGDGGRADNRFQGFGRFTVAPDGQYRFRTMRPAPYSGRTPHIHVKVRLGERELLTTQLYVDGDPGNPRDFLWRRLSADERAALTVPFVPDNGVLRARFSIVVA